MTLLTTQLIRVGTDASRTNPIPSSRNLNLGSGAGLVISASDWSSKKCRQDLCGYIFHHGNWEQRKAVKQKRHNASST